MDDRQALLEIQRRLIFIQATIFNAGPSDARGSVMDLKRLVDEHLASTPQPTPSR